MNGSKFASLVKQHRSRQRYGIVMFNKSAEIETKSKLANWSGVGFKGTKEQQVIWKQMKGSHNILVNAYAGTGKTSTSLKGISQLVDAHKVECSTSHAMSLEIIKESRPNVKIKQYKMHDIVNEMLGIRPRRDVGKAVMQLRDNAVEIVGLLKNTLIYAGDPQEADVFGLCDTFGIDTGSTDESKLFEIVKDAMQKSLEDEEHIDFDDMVFLPAFLGLAPKNKFKFLIVDECQDYNMAQLVSSFHMAERFMFIGDRFQSIYAFRGADANSMVNIGKQLCKLGGYEDLPLTVTQRCSTAVVESVLEFVPDFKARAKAPQGFCVWDDLQAVRKKFKYGDMVLSRDNLSLCKEAHNLMANRKKCKISGRVFGKSLVKFVESFKTNRAEVLVQELNDYETEQLEKLKAKAKYRPVDTLVDAIRDKVGCIRVLANGKSQTSEVVDEIESLFDDEIKDRNKIVFLSTVHKAKGDESENVFILNRDMMPSVRGSSEQELQQEKNICYVGHTRAKNGLTLVQSPYDFSGRKK